MLSETLLDDYINYIKQNTFFYTSNQGITEVVTPFTNAFGEGISFAIKPYHNKIIVSDQGFATWNLAHYGIHVTSKKDTRNRIFVSLLDYHGFTLSKDGTIYKIVTRDYLPQAIHDMTQLLINTYDLVFTYRNKHISLFHHDVSHYFQQHRQHYYFFSNFSISGKSQLNYHIDYVFLKEQQSNLVKVHTKLSKQQVDSTLVLWLDTIDKRKKEYNETEKLFILLSEEGYHNARDSYISALNEYNISLLNFDNKQQLQQALSHS